MKAAQQHPRVVSLLPSATDIIAVAGGVDLLVGRSHECNWPSQVERLPVLTGAVNEFVDSKQMDDVVKASLDRGEGLYFLEQELLKNLQPDAAAQAASKGNQPIKVAFVEWLDPLFVGGHWTPEMITMAGGTHPLNMPIGGGGAGPSIRILNQALVDADCDWIIVCPCGFSIEDTKKEQDLLSSKTWWQNLRAVQNSKVVIVDGNQMFARPGPRLVDALEFLQDKQEVQQRKWRAAPYLGPDIEEAHAAAIEAGQTTYVDPASGYKVMTEQALRQQSVCCANRCRHCPFGHYKVPANRGNRINTITQATVLKTNRKDAQTGRFTISLYLGNPITDKESFQFFEGLFETELDEWYLYKMPPPEQQPVTADMMCLMLSFLYDDWQVPGVTNDRLNAKRRY
ncbi:hypothetical protein WJX79_010907 [Trebouxia sp. C0005]